MKINWNYFRRYFLLLGISLLTASLFAQLPTIPPPNDTIDLTFTGTKINPYSIEYDTTGQLTFSGYFDTYYAYYSDTVGTNGFSKFPTIAPRNNTFGLNIIQLSARYESMNFRGTATVFGGDCPSSSWSTVMNYVQEANLGFRIKKNWWLDAGFFRTHIGLESIQPRENMAMSLAVTTYFEPYFLSGAKLTWQHSPKLAFQLNAFNSFNQFIETNKNKAVGISIAYNPNPKVATTFSSILSKEDLALKQLRSYSNFCLTWKTHRLVVGFEINYGVQTNSNLLDSSKASWMFSSLLAAKYRIHPKWSNYSRLEIYEDENEILTGPVINQNQQLVGIDLGGLTYGWEFKPIPNSYLRIETRYLHTRQEEAIFDYHAQSMNHRWEWIAALGVWF